MFARLGMVTGQGLAGDHSEALRSMGPLEGLRAASHRQHGEYRRLPLVGDAPFWVGEFSTGTMGNFRPELTGASIVRFARCPQWPQGSPRQCPADRWTVHTRLPVLPARIKHRPRRNRSIATAVDDESR